MQGFALPHMKDLPQLLFLSWTQDQSEGMGLDTSVVVGNLDSMADAKLRSEIPVKEMYSIGNYHSPKVLS